MLSNVSNGLDFSGLTGENLNFKNASLINGAKNGAKNVSNNEVNNTLKNGINNEEKNKTSIKIDTPIVKKGEAGYIPDMDIDGDGVITHDEFNQYCDEKQMGLKDRLRLMETMQASKILNEAKNKEEDNDEEYKKQIIYAKSGDENYEAEMDSNSDGKVTYEEYLRYCEKQRQGLKDSFNSKANAYREEIEPEEPEIKIEAQA